MGAIEWRLNEINGCYNKLTDLPQITANPLSPLPSPSHFLFPSLKSRARVSAHLIEFQLYNQTSCSLEFWVLRAQTGKIFLTPPSPRTVLPMQLFHPSNLRQKFRNGVKRNSGFLFRNKYLFCAFWHWKHFSAKFTLFQYSIFLNSSYWTN